jgi:hypothetical protein
VEQASCCLDGELSEQFCNNLFTAYFLASGNIRKDPMESTDTKGFMPGNGNIMISAVNIRSKTLMTARLVDNPVSVPRKSTCEFIAIDISWQFHTGISSSFTR